MGTVAEPKTVVVTGFGPFGNHVVNASWVAVEELNKIGIDDDVNLIVDEIAVEYETVRETIPQLWKKYSPTLVVHVGVSGVAKELTLEQQAHNDGYNKFDVKGCTPCDNCCVEGSDNLIVSHINQALVSEDVNKAEAGICAVVSKDPGRYLCDYIFFTSLNIDPSRSAFIHVPPLNKPYNAELLAKGLQLAIKSMLTQIS